MPKTSRRAKRQGSRGGVERADSDAENSDSPEAIKAAEQVALQAFASGLKLAAAFGSVAAKTTSLALASLASGADKFSELVKQEALRSSREKSINSPRPRNTRKRSRNR